MRSAAATAIDGMSNYRSCRMPTRQPRDEWHASGVQRRRAITGRNLLSACPRAELHGPAGRPVGLCDRPDDRSPDSRIKAERQSLPVLSEHSDWRPLAPACRPLPAHSGGTVWDSHPLPGIIGSKAVARQYSTAVGHPRTGGARRKPHRSGPRRPMAGLGGPWQQGPRHSTGVPSCLKCFVPQSCGAPRSQMLNMLPRHALPHGRPSPAGFLAARRRLATAPWRLTDPGAARRSTRTAG